MTPDLPAVEAAIVEMTNQFRRDQKLGALRRDGTLDAIARSFARYLARTGKFAHEADGRSAGDRAQAGGYAYCQIAENLALNADSRGFENRQLARDAVEGWKQSPGHRRNMLGAYATDIGVGVAKAPGRHRYLSVQLFGRPQALKFQFKIRNKTSLKLTYRYEEKSHDAPPRVMVTHTVCRPGELSFGPEARRSNRAGRQFRFTTQPGDVFAAVPASGGRFRVLHTPRAR